MNISISLNGLILMNLFVNKELNKDKITSLGIVIASLYGRHLARKNFTPPILFSANIVLVPISWFYAYKFKHIDLKFDHHRRRYFSLNL
jgi:hypothetical protein